MITVHPFWTVIPMGPNCLHTLSRASNMMMLFPLITTMPIEFCCPPEAISRQSSITRFMKGSKPRKIPCTWRPPFSFSESFLSMNFFSSGGCALLILLCFFFLEVTLATGLISH
uniref:Uncharacterized protein n=1 Tax=Anguilla anguilla TaxID=7936 RepID=A0A0E9XEX3_ANGAN